MSADRSPRAWVKLPTPRPDDDGWRHRPWWKVAANHVLRLGQRGSLKWVFYSVCEADGDGRPRATSYGFGPVEHS